MNKKLSLSKTLAAVLCFTFIAPFSHLALASEDQLAGAELLKQLRQGGYSIYFRHGITDHGQSGNRKFTYSEACLEAGECGSCDQQRGLNEAGREQSRQTGDVIKALNIPVGEVLASPLCRTMDTATLMFGRAQASVDVRDGGFGPTSHPRLKKIVAKSIAAGSNQVVSGHSGQFQIVTDGKYHLEEGEAAIIKAQGNGEFKIVAQIRSEQWQGLMQYAQ